MTTLDLRQAASAQRAIWNDLVGDAWVRHAGVHDRQAEPFGAAAMEAVGNVAGASVLDVGCGTGATSIALAGRGAREVTGIDISAPMINAARAGHCYPEITFTHDDVLALELPGHFDVIFSRFGMTFFADPVGAFAHLRTLGTPTARLGFCCWGPPADNPFMLLPVMATIPVLGPPQLAAPGEPGPFSLASPERIADVLTRSGWTGVAIEPLTIDQAHPAGDAAAVARVAVEFNPLIVQGLRQHPERLDDALAAITDALAPFERDSIVHLQASALVVTAQALATGRS